MEPQEVKNLATPLVVGELPFDAVEVAKLFAQTIEANPQLPFDTDTMLGWFANATMRGWDEHARRLPDMERDARKEGWESCEETIVEWLNTMADEARSDGRAAECDFLRKLSTSVEQGVPRQVANQILEVSFDDVMSAAGI